MHQHRIAGSSSVHCAEGSSVTGVHRLRKGSTNILHPHWRQMRPFWSVLFRSIGVCTCAARNSLVARPAPVFLQRQTPSFMHHLKSALRRRQRALRGILLVSCVSVPTRYSQRSRLRLRIAR